MRSDTRRHSRPHRVTSCSFAMLTVFAVIMTTSTLTTNFCEAKLQEATVEQLKVLKGRTRTAAKNGKKQTAAKNTLNCGVITNAAGQSTGAPCGYDEFCAASPDAFVCSDDSCVTQCTPCTEYAPIKSFTLIQNEGFYDMVYDICNLEGTKIWFGSCITDFEKQVDDKWFKFPTFDDDEDVSFSSLAGFMEEEEHVAVMPKNDFVFNEFCFSKDAKSCCEPSIPVVAGVVTGGVVFITALTIIICFCCRCFCFKNRQEQ